MLSFESSAHFTQKDYLDSQKPDSTKNDKL